MIEITGVLVDKSGGPIADTTVLVYPLDAEGNPMSLSAAEASDTPGMVTIGAWNPQGKTRADGRFTMQMPLVSKIAGKEIREVGLSPEGPPGGWGATTVVMIEYASPGREPEKGFQTDVKGLKLLRQGGKVIRIKLGASGERTDVGEVVRD